MTNKLEKQFFDTFGIESKKGCTAYDKLEEHEADVICNDECSECLYFDDVYPCITDRILLELICIDFEENPYKCRGGVDITNVKEYILNEFIRDYEDDLYHDKQDIKHQVRTLFEEG